MSATPSSSTSLTLDYCGTPLRIAPQALGRSQQLLLAWQSSGRLTLSTLGSPVSAMQGALDVLANQFVPDADMTPQLGVQIVCALLELQADPDIVLHFVSRLLFPWLTARGPEAVLLALLALPLDANVPATTAARVTDQLAGFRNRVRFLLCGDIARISATHPHEVARLTQADRLALARMSPPDLLPPAVRLWGHSCAAASMEEDAHTLLQALLSRTPQEGISVACFALLESVPTLWANPGVRDAVLARFVAEFPRIRSNPVLLEQFRSLLPETQAAASRVVQS